MPGDKSCEFFDYFFVLTSYKLYYIILFGVFLYLLRNLCCLLADNSISWNNMGRYLSGHF